MLKPLICQTKNLFFLILGIFTCTINAQTPIGGVINDYTALVTINNPGCAPCDQNTACLNQINVADASTFSIGDKALIVQLKGATINPSNAAFGGTITDIGNAGNYEFFDVGSVSGNTILPTTSLKNTYDSSGQIQLIRVPVYPEDVEITSELQADPWDDATGKGGIIALFVNGTLTLSANVNASGSGYTGVEMNVNGSPDNCSINPNTQLNLPSSNTDSWFKGGGISEPGAANTKGRAPLGNGGGSGVSGDSGGGGGGNFGAGGVGGSRRCNTIANGGAVAGGLGGYGLSTFIGNDNRVFFGGAGGAGFVTSNNPSQASNGGGIVVIRATNLVGNNFTINASGENSQAAAAGIDGGGGGGAGGSVAFDIASYFGALNINISGGNGQTLTTDVIHGPGGGGGGGVFLHNLSTVPSGMTVDTTGGTAGTHNGSQSSNTNGAMNGSVGGVVNYYKFVETANRDFSVPSDDLSDFCDLDSDNDGILDSIEDGGTGFDPSQDEDADDIPNYIDQNDVTVGFPPFVDANGDGTNDIYDFDGDSIPNFQDLDSDNDGIPDNIEAQTTLGYVAPSGNDTNTDGVDDTYAGGLTPENTDGTDNPDYLNLDSDNEGGNDTTEAGLSLSGIVGANGLDANSENTDDYADVNGSFDNTQTNNFIDADNDATTGGDVDYRDAIFGCFPGSGLIVNEASNGSGGSQDWMEFAVVGDATNPTAAVDLTGWIIDDNNGDFEGPTGTGVAAGYLKFTSSYMAVPPGSLILVYNVGDKDPAIGADDPTDSNGDGVYIIPSGDDTYLSGCTGSDYSTCTSGSNSWSKVALRNGGDAAQVRRPDGSFYHGYSFGDVTAPFPTFPCGVSSFNAGSGGVGSTFAFQCGDWETGTNHVRSGASGRTPGTINSTDNQTFVTNIANGTFDYANPANPDNCVAPPTISITTPIEGDDVINVTESVDVTISGTTTAVETGQIVTVTLSDGINSVTTTATIQSDGSWTASDADISTLTEGTITVDADVTDVNSNPANDQQNVVLDTTDPAIPTVVSQITNDTTPIIEGTAEANSTVTVIVGGATYTTTADASGDWTIDTGTATPDSGTFAPNVNGTNEVAVTSTDAAGNSSVDATTLELTIDTTDPAIPTVVSQITNDTTPIIEGTAEANSTVTVVVAGATYTTTADASGDWTIDTGTTTPDSGTFAPDINGTNEVAVTSTDAAGNASVDATTLELTIDTTDPAIPTVVSQITNDTTPIIEGTAEANSTVTVVVAGATYTTTADTSGDWTIDTGTATPDSGTFAPNVNGTNEVAVTSTDAAGNSSVDATTLELTIDTTDPAVPTVVSQITNDTTPVLNGTAEANSTVTVIVGGATYTTTANASGDWTIDTGTATPDSGTFAPNVNGTNEVAVTSTDAAGNSSVDATTLELTIDTTDPVINIDIVAIDDVINALEDESPLTISGTTDAENGQTVTLALNEIIYTTTVSGGTWNVVVPAIAVQALDADEMITADVSDLASNPAVQATRDIEYDPTAPNVPLVSSISNDTETNGDAVTSDNTLLFNGIAEPNSEIEVFIDGIAVGTTITDTSGNWSFDYQATVLADGPFVITVTATDSAGNTSIASPDFPIIIDTSVPSVDSFSTDDVTPVFTGQGNTNETLLVKIDMNGESTPDVLYTVTTDGNGDWSLDTQTAVADLGSFPSLTDGDILHIMAIDPAGNQGTGAVNISIDIDGDGLTDNEEDALGTDPNNPDSDGDGISDGQEVVDGTDPLEDCDSLNGTPLPSSDCDGDGLGNDMEVQISTDQNNSDSDGDGLIDGEEVSLGTDPNNQDSDGDGVTDGQEVDDTTNPLDDCDSENGTALFDSDCDDDRLTNVEETERGTDPNNADTDGDSIDDGREVMDGTNPLNACSSKGGTPPANLACDITIETDLVGPGINGGIFKITNIESYTNNTVRIYNRWGVLVFETNGYDNVRNAFRGISKGRVTISKTDELPVGVYFYIIDYMNQEEAKTKNGYLYVTR